MYLYITSTSKEKGEVYITVIKHVCVTLTLQSSSLPVSNFCSSCYFLNLFFFFFTAAPGTVKTWFPVRHPLPPPSLCFCSLTPLLPPASPPLPSPRLLYLCRGPAVTEHSVRRIRQLSLKNNKRSWKKRQEFLGSDVTPFTWRVLLLSVQPPTSVSCTSPAPQNPSAGYLHAS